MDGATKFIISLFFGLFVGGAAGQVLVNLNSPWWMTAIGVVVVAVLIGWLVTKFWPFVDSRRAGRGNDG